MQIRADDAADLAEGATLLGSGGGGAAAAMTAVLRHALRLHGPVPLIHAADLDPDAWVVPVGAIGAISVMVERPPSGTEFAAAVRALERHLGIEAVAVHGLETGGINALLAVATAAWLGLPLVDADGMGRAFPRLDQTVFTLAGLPTAPIALADPSGTEMLITRADGAALERLARTVLPALGGWAASAQCAMRAETSRRHALPGTFSRALEFGRALGRARHDPAERDRMLEYAHARRLGTGTVLEVRQRGRTSVTGSVTVEHAADGRTLRLEMADEYLLALDEGVVTARVPEIIAVLHARTWRHVSTEEVAAGQHVDILALPAPAALGTPEADRLMGPTAFGLDMPDEAARGDGHGTGAPGHLTETR
ncbi:DUF917 domain-containing protein [Streptosporangium sp. NPDC051023]|uniref:DUF917 domain-containing protein n=1 Tax=Streptosporangium sp. NPDC051023 TaxID=3155410 RepID=UPI003450A4B9